MRKHTVIALSLALFGFGCEAVKFKEMALYDAYAEPVAEEQSSADIFTESEGTMWNSLFSCGEFELTNETANSGKTSIKLSWDKGKGCEWIGFGNSWNNWIPTDMSEERFKKALSFHVRTQTKTARAIPIVAAMEDFSGGGSYYFVDARKYLYGLEMDTTWKQVIVPLWHFPVDDRVDISTIKQMQFQLEGAGSFYLDDIRLIDYTEEEYAAMREEVEEMRPKGNPEQTIYREGKFRWDAWGYENNRCQEIKEITDYKSNKMIYWKYSNADCDFAKWGINWNDWYAMNVRGILDKSKVSFKFRSTKGAKFEVQLQDFTGKAATVYTHNGAAQEEWMLIEVPLKDLDLKGKNFGLDRIRQLHFEGKSDGEVWLDDIQLIPIQ